MKNIAKDLFKISIKWRHLAKSGHTDGRAKMAMIDLSLAQARIFLGQKDFWLAIRSALKTILQWLHN